MKKKNITTTNKRKNIIFPILVTSLLLVIIFLALVMLNKLQIFKNNNSQFFKQNSEINGINISNLSRSEAIEVMNSYLKKKTENFSVTLKHNDKIYILDEDDYTINKDLHTIIDYASGENKDLLDSLNYFTSNGNSTQVSFNFIFQGLEDKINAICDSIETKPIDSTISFNPDRETLFEITEDKDGLLVNREKLYEDINKQFQISNNVLVDLCLEPAKANITKDYNKSLTTLVSKFSTGVKDSTGGRKHNVNLALSKFNGMVIEPNETISFNEVTSPHSLDNGYQIATIIYKGRFVDGVGGGICQASTTLYNALVQAGIKIEEVHKHTLPVKYVPLALDSMVSEGIADLKFTNQTEYPLYIKTSHTKDDVTVEIYSKTNEDGYTYSTRSETINQLPALPDKIVADTEQEHTDKVIFKGETYRLSYGSTGYEAKSYIQKWKDNKLISEEPLRHEVYSPQPGIIVEGIYEPLED